VSGQVVTGEAVQLELRPATFASRAVSGTIDVVLQVGLLIVLFIVAARLGADIDGAAASALFLVIVVFVLVGLPVTTETLTRGRTPGKLVMGLRTVRDDGGPIRFRHAMVRGLLEFVEVFLLFGVPALFSSLVSAQGKRLGDVAAGTYVVRERGAARPAPPPVMPPHLAGWAQHADIARLPDGMALSVRQFLGRAASLHLGSRASLGAELAQAVSAHVAPPPRRERTRRTSWPRCWPSAAGGTSAGWLASARPVSTWRASTRWPLPWTVTAASRSGTGAARWRAPSRPRRSPGSTTAACARRR
jgi:uncharacterized RDD family membrane protein YckC